MLKLENINKSFAGKQVLFDINTIIQKGEIVGIIGPNGAGKSTSMKILTGFYKTDTGDVKIDGKSIFKNNDLKKQIGYLPEINPLYEDMGVDEFLYYTADLKGIKNKNEEIDKVISMTGLKDKKYKFINTLSKGYKQRVGLASALIGDPDILVLDEPTEGLDPNQRDEMKNLISNLGKTKTILISSHVLSELSGTVNRVIIISDGKIKLDDSIENIQLAHNKKMVIKIIFDGNIDSSLIKQKFKDIEEIKIDNNSMEIITITDIRKQLLNYMNNNFDILEFYSKKIDLSDIFFETIK